MGLRELLLWHRVDEGVIGSRATVFLGGVVGIIVEKELSGTGVREKKT